MAICSMKVPSINVVRSIPNRMRKGETSNLVITSMSSRLTPLKARIWLKAIEPAMIINTMAVTSTALIEASLRVFKFNFP